MNKNYSPGNLKTVEIVSALTAFALIANIGIRGLVKCLIWLIIGEWIDF